jgi:UDP-N-acetylglucosamine 2-epimerase (non-hydrolysing)/GDP/UDP-N,N'-diacetylbacillosamine 2-epimerase (hydrolysing)
MHEVREDPDLDLQIVATGMHLSPEFGLTYQQIEEDGFVIDETIEMLLSSDTPVGIAKSIGLGTIGFADAFKQLGPDIVVLLGDRFEILAAAQAAMVARIPIAHIHGGETTEGAIDESIRHAITKMAHLHLTAAAPFRKRVIQMGEAPSRVFNVGAPGLDHLKRLDLLDREAFEASIDFEIAEPTFLITCHPATLANISSEEAIDQLFAAIDTFPEATLIFTKSNADADGRVINQRIESYVEQHKRRARVYTSLGQRRYLSALHHVDVVIGNSSSGIIEAPAVPIATVNIGDRQKGRLRARSVIDVSADTQSIIQGIEQALSDLFQKNLQDVSSPYGDGEASPRICQHLKTVDTTNLMTSFHDLSFEVN